MRFKTVKEFRAAAERLIRKQAPDATIVWHRAARHKFTRTDPRNPNSEVDGWNGYGEFAAAGFKPKRFLATYQFAGDIDELEVR
jgi:hypothetical protein